MASFPASPESAAYRLGELTACWDQAYEALTQGDLERVASLLDIAEEHLAGLPHASDDDSGAAAARQQAVAARGRLEHGMRVGLEGLGHELGRVRQGSKMLQGYRDSTRGLGLRFERNV